ncbi:hypothetical protein D8B29_24870 [Verminephrobacter eiseniae]|nr:hypothetical protein [Verminephrobacter eiseniae]MCW5305749.1 hypothetical protein [Verminephrobacter eiseniae]MCW8182650.1 hypothetical protein [Verminephrobacter eiseniae]MCW8192831.1 hypothetical protein [Verminephrobacter eiseniae]
MSDRITLQMPQNACDCHTHVVGPRSRYPMAEGRRYTPGLAPHGALLAHLVSCHRSDVAGCVPPSERSARRSARPIPRCIGKRCNAAMRFDGQRRPTDDR